MQQPNSIRPWYRPSTPWLAVLSGLLLLLAGAGSSSVMAAANSSGFASVTLKNRSMQEIVAATAKVFAEDGYRGGKTASGQMVFEKEASKATSLAREGVAGTQAGAQTVIRVRADIIPLGDDTHRLQCKAFMVTGGSDPFFQDEVPVSGLRKRPYQSLLKKVEKQLK